MNVNGSRCRIAVVTGSRAEFGLLAPVMRAIRAHANLELVTIAAGSHYVPPALTFREVQQVFGVDAAVRMQRDPNDVAHRDPELASLDGAHRLHDAAAVGRGVSGFTVAFARLAPRAVVVLGDRIEALAAAVAASVGGIPLAHIHGGDRAEGIADEAMRHAISKLAHLHFAATATSAERLIRMGEPRSRVHVTGSPSIDGLAHVTPMTDAIASELGDPRAILLLHPAGQSPEDERATAHQTCRALAAEFGARVLALAPNHDSGRTAIHEEITMYANKYGWRQAEHLPRETFVSLLKRLAIDKPTRGLLVGNSSAGLIEAAATRTLAINIGPRQHGRERGANVIDVAGGVGPDVNSLDATLRRALHIAPSDVPLTHPYGDGAAGERIAGLLASAELGDPALLRKHNAY